MDFLEVMHAYFRGERLEAFFYILPAGVVLLGMAGTALYTDRGGFGWGMAVVFALFGLVCTGVGFSVGARSPGQAAAIEAAYAEDPAAMLEEELPRMEQVNANWPRLLLTWAALVVIGLGLRFGSKADWAHGVAIGLLVCGSLGFVIDGFAERRARPYSAALETLADGRDAVP